MNRVLVCNSQRGELEAIQEVLRNSYAVHLMSSWDKAPLNLQGVDAIVLDVNFTPAQGLDFLMEVCSNHYIPVLLISPPDDPQCAIEARRIGAFNYCVKTERLHSVLEMAVREMIFAYSDQQELKHTIMALKARIAILEGQLKEKTTQTPAAPAAAKTQPNSQQQRASMLQEIAKRLNNGEINLPSLPSISYELEELVRKDAGIDAIATLLRKDMAVSAKLISVANSPRYGGLRQSSTVEQAINVLGLNTSKEFVDIIANRALYMARNPQYQAILKDLWKHGVACAHASYLIAGLAKLSRPREVFFMGLMHDIGKLFLIQVISELQARNVIDPPSSKKSLDDFLEKHHGLFGRKLLEIWKLPAEIAVVAQFHEALEQATTVTRELLAVALGNLLAKRAGYGLYNPKKDDGEVERTAKSIGLEPAHIQKVLKELVVFMEETGLSFD
ncbi:HDOD domain-containing protein [Nitrosomonas sp. wSCUT-2]